MLSKQTLKILKCAVRFRLTKQSKMLYLPHYSERPYLLLSSFMENELKNTSRIVSTAARLPRYLPSYVMEYTGVKENLTKELR